MVIIKQAHQPSTDQGGGKRRGVIDGSGENKVPPTVVKLLECLAEMAKRKKGGQSSYPTSQYIM